MLTFVCMLRCWTWDAVPNWLLYSSVLHVRRYADTATFSQFRTGRKRPLPSLAVGVEYSRAMKSHFRKFGNQMSGSGNHLCNYASLLA